MDLLTDSNLAGWLWGAEGIVSLLPEGVQIAGPASGAVVIGAVPDALRPPAEIERGRALPSWLRSEEPGVWKWEGRRVYLPMVRHAVESLQEKSAVLPNEWKLLSDVEKAKAFTVANAARTDGVIQVQEAVREAVAEGSGFEEFEEKIAGSLNDSDVGPGQLQTIFRTNVARAYTEGKQKMLDKPMLQELFPYRKNYSILDGRISELCETINESGIQGTSIFRADDRVWKAYCPPRHHNCRCSWTALSRHDAALEGIREAQEWVRTGRPPAAPAFVPMPRVGLPPGWISPIST